MKFEKNDDDDNDVDNKTLIDFVDGKWKKKNWKISIELKFVDLVANRVMWKWNLLFHLRELQMQIAKHECIVAFVESKIDRLNKMASFYFCLIRIRNRVSSHKSQPGWMIEWNGFFCFLIFGQSYVNCIFMNIINDVNHDCRPVKVENKCVLIWVSFNSTRKRNGIGNNKKTKTMPSPGLHFDPNRTIFQVYFFSAIARSGSIDFFHLKSIGEI